MGLPYTRSQFALKVTAVFAVLSGACRASAETTDPTRFVRPVAVAGAQHAGAAPLEQSFGGLYAYAAEATRPASGLRLVLGDVLRTQFTLLSAEEEAAMWTLRERLLRGGAAASAHPTSRRRASTGHGTRPSAASAGQQVRVIETPDKTCVPELAHASAADWREHLVCWLKGSRTVEVQRD